MVLAIILIITAYLLGSIPFALVIGKGIYGVDVREQGSGNTGTTNVFRVLGKQAGLLVFAGDLAKGFLPVLVVSQVAPEENAALVTVLVAGAAIAGHNWSLFLKGKGGKGVATGGGAILAMMPWLFLLAFAIFWLVLAVDRRVSVASLSAASGLSAATLVTGQPVEYIIFTLLGTAIVFYAHRSNIRRISRGEEDRVDMPWSRRSNGHARKRSRETMDRPQLTDPRPADRLQATEPGTTNERRTADDTSGDADLDLDAFEWEEPSR